ncbi:transporter substrate-binding domain-containing protein [Marinomonas sp. A79]|uniref:Transporter substrate-binding domain-containing protein n=1 Tax=Marinomonas vulgaris TaxID=2823372 RepID=A0ABS5HAX1_9GAMM|nr:transporter substrate-binding domain-containing protein [Marinomonas vulgaris]MBR7888796.1 transporter substrate-binding domain-containing protein [Marinomonas vulgaris]
MRADLVVAAFCWFILWPKVAAADTSIETLSTMTVRVCGNSAYPPVSWVNADQQADGVNVAVIKMLLEPLGVTVDTHQDSSWRRCLKEVELGNIDMMSGFKTEARQAFMTFLDAPVIRESIYLYFPIDNPLEFKGWDTLAGLRVGVLRGDSFGDEVDAALNAYPTLEYVSTQDQNLLKLADNRLDMVPMGKLSGQLDILRLGLQGKTGHIQTDVVDFWYLAISNRSPLLPWLPFLNERLTRLLDSPETVPELVERYRRIYIAALGLNGDFSD